MVKHVVMWKLKPEAAATPEILDANIARMEKRYQEMKEAVPDMISYELYRNFKHGNPDFCEFMVVMTFASREDLKTFQESPSHTDPVAREFGRSIRERRAVVDYEI